MCILAPESTTNSLSSGFMVDAVGIIHFPVGEHNVALSISLSLVTISGKIPCLAAGASLLSFSLFLRSVLKFHSVDFSRILA